MAQFTDGKNRTWQLNLDAPKISSVRSSLDINLIDEEGQAMQKLASDPILLVDVLWHLCSPQVEPGKVTPVDFAEGLVGDVIETATAALVQAVVDFFPKRKRALLTAIVTEQRNIETLATEKAMAKLSDPTLREQVTTMVEKALDERVQEALTALASATSSPDIVPFRQGA
jgi:hypothetical protein